MKVNIYNSFNKLRAVEKKNLVEFLFEHLDEFGDRKEDIQKAIDYSINENGNLPLSISFGGFSLIAYNENNSIIGAVVINRTGMSGYIPENILVYIATHREYRGKGIGKQLMKKAIEVADGDIALHVEPNNPAKFLYEKIGFTNKYLEMRYKK